MRLVWLSLSFGCVARAADAPADVPAPPADAPAPRAGALPDVADDDPDVVALGRALFFDDAISLNGNQSCATCHGPGVGWTGPDEALNRAGAVYAGSVPERFGNRKPTTVAYAGWSPVLHLENGAFVGGNFWDGRATGEQFGNPAIDQAQGPPLNPLEQALPDAAAVVTKVCSGGSADAFRAVWGEAACADPDLGFEAFARAVAAFEASPAVSPFSSKYDASLDGRARLDREEKLGLTLFSGKAQCATCHALRGGTHDAPPLFTDFSYENIGVPKNPENPFYAETDFNPDGAAWIDEGLAGFLATRPEYAARAAVNRGRHRVPTLRNVDARPSPDFVKAYGHNGYFKSLEEIVHFYNTRDALPECAPGDPGEKTTCWPASEVTDNRSPKVGNLGLKPREERAIVAFLRTLTDGWSGGEADARGAREK